MTEPEAPTGCVFCNTPEEEGPCFGGDRCMARVAPSPDAPGLREAAQNVVDRAHINMERKDTGLDPLPTRVSELERVLAASGDAPREGLRTKPWLVRLTCCGRADGVYAADSWDEAQAFREAYTSGPGVSGGHVGDTGHVRSAVIEDALAATPDAPGLLAALDEFAPSLAPDYPRYARWLRAKEAIRAALAATGNPEGIDVEALGRALVAVRKMHDDLLVTPTAEAIQIAAEYARQREGEQG